MKQVQSRAFRALNLLQFDNWNSEDDLGICEMQLPNEDFYILRMLIKTSNTELLLPEELKWCIPLISMAVENQKSMGINQPFVYLTIRKGECKSTLDDEWHVDGFSMRVTHLPEQNYVYVDNMPTEVVHQPVDFPKEFNPLVYNIHKYLENFINPTDIQTLKENHLYCMDPYVIHRRPPNTKGVERTFVRLSFTPLEIDDVNNTLNPLLPTNYTRDGNKDFRDHLLIYQEH